MPLSDFELMGKFATPYNLGIYLSIPCKRTVFVLSWPPKSGHSTSLSAKTLRTGPFLLLFIYTPKLSVECVMGIVRVL